MAGRIELPKIREEIQEVKDGKSTILIIENTFDLEKEELEEIFTLEQLTYLELSNKHY